MTPSVSFADLLQSALAEPGMVSQAYHAFHGYSLGNQLLAMIQCAERGITPGPIATFMGWKDKGRYVRKGEKALVLCMPITVKRTESKDQPTACQDDTKPAAFTRFVFRPNWFVLSQTEGQNVEPMPIPEWDRARALDTLGIVEEPFAMTDGNCQGYARGRSIAVSPVAELPHKTRSRAGACRARSHGRSRGRPDRFRTDAPEPPRSRGRGCSARLPGCARLARR